MLQEREILFAYQIDGDVLMKELVDHATFFIKKITLFGPFCVTTISLNSP
jgi:hypothetical protein